MRKSAVRSSSIAASIVPQLASVMYGAPALSVTSATRSRSAAAAETALIGVQDTARDKSALDEHLKDLAQKEAAMQGVLSDAAGLRKRVAVQVWGRWSSRLGVCPARWMLRVLSLCECTRDDSVSHTDTYSTPKPQP